jgi:hypothetical protein
VRADWLTLERQLPPQAPLRQLPENIDKAARGGQDPAKLRGAPAVRRRPAERGGHGRRRADDAGQRQAFIESMVGASPPR